MEPLYQISGLLAAISDNDNILKLYGFNENLCLMQWCKNFVNNTNLPCKLKAIFPQEIACPIQIAAMHKSLPLFLAVTEYENKQNIAISYEAKQEFKHAGFFAAKDLLRYRILNIYWINYLPLFILLNDQNTLNIVGIYNETFQSKSNLNLHNLISLASANVPCLWKSYFSLKFSTIQQKIEKLLHIETIIGKSKYKETLLCFGDSSVINLFYIKIKDGLTISCKLKGQQNRIDSKKILSEWLFEGSNSGKIRFCLHIGNGIEIYSGILPGRHQSWKCELINIISLDEELQLLKVNTSITLMCKSQIVNFAT